MALIVAVARLPLKILTLVFGARVNAVTSSLFAHAARWLYYLLSDTIVGTMSNFVLTGWLRSRFVETASNRAVG